MHRHLDPSYWRNQPRWSPLRLLSWTLRRRYMEIMASLRQQNLRPVFERAGARIKSDPGTSLVHTAVTSSQLELLLEAVAASEALETPVVEIGSYRGSTTAEMAARTRRKVYAVDPYQGDGGHSHDRDLFRERTRPFANVSLIEQPSGPAREEWGSAPVSLVFIDAMHEYVHTWFDFIAWSDLVEEGGFVAFHDTDKFPGVNLVCQRILKSLPEYRPWGFAPNLLVFQRRTR